MDSNKLTYSRTVTTTPENGPLLNLLVERYVEPVLRKRVAQGAMHRDQTPEEQLESILNFGRSERIDVPQLRQQQSQPKNIAQGGLNSKEIENLDKLLAFGAGKTTDEEITA